MSGARSEANSQQPASFFAPERLKDHFSSRHLDPVEPCLNPRHLCSERGCGDRLVTSTAQMHLLGHTRTKEQQHTGNLLETK